MVELRLVGARNGQAVSRLSRLRRLDLRGDLESLALRGPSALESLTLLQSSESSLRSLRLVGLHSLENVVVEGGELDEGLHLEDLSALRGLALDRCGLTQIPVFSDPRLTRLSLVGNQILDLSPAGRYAGARSASAEPQRADVAGLPTASAECSGLESRAQSLGSPTLRWRRRIFLG